MKRYTHISLLNPKTLSLLLNIADLTTPEHVGLGFLIGSITGDQKYGTRLGLGNHSALAQKSTKTMGILRNVTLSINAIIENKNRPAFPHRRAPHSPTMSLSPCTYAILVYRDGRWTLVAQGVAARDVARRIRAWTRAGVTVKFKKEVHRKCSRRKK